jgi:mono/diheme cytochrome c family protein
MPFACQSDPLCAGGASDTERALPSSSFGAAGLKAHKPMSSNSAAFTLFVAIAAVGFPLRAVEAEGKVDFSGDIKPILESVCVQCHGPEKQKGKLRLDSRAAWLKGGDNGPIFKAGHPEESDFFQRVTLAEDQDDVMPPKGKADHLTPAQIDLVKRWITEGAEWPEGVLAVASPNKGGTAHEPGDLAGPSPSADELKAVEELARRGIKARPLAAGINWRRVDLRSVADKVSAEDLAKLARIPSIQELNLAGVPLRDADLANIAELKNLTVLHLENTPITDEGLTHLSKLEKLDYLNLFGTAVTDAGLKNLTGLSHLNRLYLAGTKVTGSGVSALRQRLPNLLIESGAEFADVAAAKDPEPPKKK